MWLKKTVGISMIITCVMLNALVLMGLFIPDKLPPPVAVNTSIPTPTIAAVPPPTISLTATPSSISAGLSSALSWTTTGNPTSCTGSGSWQGPKTAFGAESTGRLAATGNFTYTLSCTSPSGTATASTVVTVGNAIAPPKPVASSAPAPATTYCGGRTPCYGSREVAAHSASGNCWGYNIDRVIDISGFDLGFHIAKTGISSVAISSICGKNLAPALSGQVSAEGQTRDHKATTKQNADRNMIPYFIGYYDATKP